MSHLSASDTVDAPPTLSQQKRQRRGVLALCIGSCVVFANLYSAQPLLPLFADTMALSELQAAWALTISTLMLSLSFLVYGPLSDTLGRKPIMVATLCGMSVVTLAIAYAESFSQLLWLRGLQGFLLGGLPAIAVAYMGEEFRAKGLATTIGLYISANSLGGISGRILSGIVAQYWDWPMVFLTLFVINIGVSFYFIIALPPSVHFQAHPLKPASLLHSLWIHLCNRRLLLAYIIGGLHFMIFLNQFSFIVFVLADAPYNLPSSLLGLLFVTYLSGSISSAIAGRVAGLLSQVGCIVTGSLLMIAGTLLTLTPNVVTIIGGLSIMSFGFFLAHSSLTAWVNQHAVQAKASASSLYLVFYYMGASIGSLYLHPFWQWQQWVGIVIGSLIVLLVTSAIGISLSRR